MRKNMEQQIDAQGVITRADELTRQVRRSEAYPAIVGGIAGGVAGALMAAIIARRVSSQRPDIQVSTPIVKETQSKGLTMRDAVQLVAVMAGLVRQIQSLSKEQNRHQA
jgi:NH3-dependent NAD+ synthetase